MSASRTSTKNRILGAAEALFAEHGFSGASLRQVTAAANVNLAAVNYHFGSKDNLIEEVIRRRLDQINERRLAALGHLPEDATLEQVLDAFIRPTLELSVDSDTGVSFVRVLARAFAEHDGRLRQFLSDNYGNVMRQFVARFTQLLPQLERRELQWRLDTVIGALTYSMADFGAPQRSPEISAAEHRGEVASHLIRFAAAGLRAP